MPLALLTAISYVPGSIGLGILIGQGLSSGHIGLSLAGTVKIIVLPSLEVNFGYSEPIPSPKITELLVDVNPLPEIVIFVPMGPEEGVILVTVTPPDFVTGDGSRVLVGVGVGLSVNIGRVICLAEIK